MSDAEDAAQYRWLLDHCQTTNHLWALLARGDKGTIEDFKIMVGRIMASEKGAFERGRSQSILADPAREIPQSTDEGAK